ncbi:MAG: signal recognition particle-docking protein FtsY [Treponema sp.]|nr:signal recognition particle-docking protein FtsY [Treponema sp.]
MNFAGKVKSFFSFGHSLPETFFDDLADLLVEGDFGAAPAMKLVERLELAAKKEKIHEETHLMEQFVQLLKDELLSADPDAQAGYTSNSQKETSKSDIKVILLLGVNGVGKTTTAAKLASRYFSMGKKPILAAADTFRAGAINQLKIHGEKLKIRVVAHQQGGDPAAVVYDAVEAALAGGGDLIITDTAGRMHTKTALVEELKKIDRVLENKLGEKPGADNNRCIKWLVLDATTGRNALAQAEIFHEAVALDGVILTKYDSSAKGGIVFSLASELKLPTVFVCDGERYDNIKLFDKAVFAGEFAL